MLNRRKNTTSRYSVAVQVKLFTEWASQAYFFISRQRSRMHQSPVIYYIGEHTTQNICMCTCKKGVCKLVRPVSKLTFYFHKVCLICGHCIYHFIHTVNHQMLPECELNAVTE